MDYVGKPGVGITKELGVEIGKYLESYGVDALNVSAGIYETMNTAWEPVGFDQGWKLDAPAAVKQAVKIPVIAASVLRDPAYVEEAIKAGKMDMMGSARAFVADPEWANKAKAGKANEIRKCISCLFCMESFMAADMTGGQMTCAVNHEAGREGTRNQDLMKKDGDGRVVAIIGAGPAGLEAARVLAIRGFKPVVFEKENYAGGNTTLASLPPKKEKTGWLIDYLLGQADKLGVEINITVLPLSMT